MQLVTLDFETYYDNEFSLSRMSTEDYVNDPRFEIIGVAIKIGDGETKWHPTHAGAVAAIEAIDWPACAMLCHHTMFDALIVAVHTQAQPPRFYLDTKSMAQAALKPFMGAASLAAVSRYLHLGEKGREVIAAKGKRITDFQADELHAYGGYCINDTELTYRIFKRMMETFPADELYVIDRTLRMYLHPVIEFDTALLEEHLEEIRERKVRLLDSLPAGVTPESLMSNPQLALVLREFGVEPPTKISPTTGKSSLAMAKTDPEFMALCEHEDERVQAIMAARLGTKSTIAETRTERFIDIAKRYGKLRVPLVYYGAHTGRWTGTENINVQNLPRKSTLRRSLMAPEGYTFVVADFKQIEARVLAWAAKQADLLTAFETGEDVYSLFAARLYGVAIDKVTEHQRFVGKTCILGLGFGMGKDKFSVTLQSKGIDWSPAQAEHAVTLYRATYHGIRGFWHLGDRLIQHIARVTEFQERWMDTPVTAGPQCVLLPNGMPLVYNHLQRDASGDWTYKSGKKWVKLYGAKFVENWVQAVARIVMTEAERRISYPMVLTVHDELVFCVPDSEIDFASQQIETLMIQQPEWAVPFGPIPLAVELSAAKRYGDAK